jgi:hypothetical protein
MRVAQKKKSPLEQQQRLSRSILWKLQRELFDREGIEAWNGGGVPHHITSNPFIAEAYVRIVFGFLRDYLSEPVETSPTKESRFEQPLYIVELGAGHGRFSYLFLKKFLKLHRSSALKKLPVKYVMTDFTERNLEYWRAHPRLRPFIEDGSLDLARFDAEHDQELKLTYSGEILSPGTLQNPIVVIANYLFDSIPQDAFVINQGQLHENLVTVSSTQPELALDDPEIFSRIELSFTDGPVSEDYYDNAEWNRILRNCRQRLPSTTFLFPIAALECIQHLQRLSSGRMLLVSGDKGFSQDDAILEGQGAPGIAVHASFSMMVDYKIIGDYFVHQRGLALHPAHPHRAINISAFISGDPHNDYAETKQAYEEAVERFGPDDLYELIRGLERIYDRLNPEQILAYLRLSVWDYQVLISSLPVLKRQLSSMSEMQKQQLHEAIRHVWDSYLHIGEDNDVAFQLGTLLLEIEFYSEALEFLQYSVDLYGIEPGTAYNMGVCYYSLRKMETALEYINQALELDSEFDAAKAMRIKLESSISRVSL